MKHALYGFFFGSILSLILIVIKGENYGKTEETRASRCSGR